MRSVHKDNAAIPVTVRGAYRLPAIMIVIGLVLAATGFQWAAHYDRQQAEKNFQEEAEQVYRNIGTEIQRHINIIDVMSHILGQISEYFSNDERGEDAPAGGRLAVITHGIQDAIKSGNVVSSDVFEMTEQGILQKVMALIAPAENSGSKDLFLVGIFDVSLFFDGGLMNLGQDYQIRVMEQNNAESPVYVWDKSAAPKQSYGFSNFFKPAPMSYERSLYLSNQNTWDLIIHPAGSAKGYRMGLLPWIVLMSICAITVLISYILWRVITEKIKAQILVETQTKDLRLYANKLEMSNRDLDDFAYVASHDLKEPLRGLYNYADILKEDYADKLDEDGKKKLETMKILAKRLESFIERLFEYSKLSRTDLAIQKVDLNKALSEVLDSLRIWLEEKNAEIVMKTPLPTVECDEVRVGEVFRNLIINGVKYNKEDNKRIEIGCHVNAEPYGDKQVFWVKDNGIGIPDEHKEYI